MIALDLFAGTGWGVACQRLGIEEHGVENMPEAIATRAANGMSTLFEDVWDGLIEPRPGLISDELRAERQAAIARTLDLTPGAAWSWYDLLIASPPCQSFSMAGKGAGRKALDEVLEAIAERAYLYPAELKAFGEKHDDKTALVLTSLAYIARDLPRLVVLEQVPPVLPVWEAYARVMREWGYSVETGILNAEQYGVPQTRRRAILVARWDKEARMPTPTHSLYYLRDKTRLDPDVLPWVSMAEALDWGMTDRPYVTIAAGTSSGGTDPAYLGGSGARKTLADERDAGRWKLRGNYSTTSREGLTPPRGSKLPRVEREIHEPAMTITSKMPSWAFERPATTIAGDARVWPPGHKINASDIERLGEEEARARYGDRAGTDAIRISADEASALQSYLPGFTWVGGKGAIAQQIGNAVPPLLAEAILKEMLK